MELLQLISNQVNKNTKVLTIGGGTGQFVLLSGLRDLKGIDITSVVSMGDSGGSTGRLRDELGILPPGDILKCILALSPHREVVRTILLKRFNNNTPLSGHNAGNLLLSMLSRYAGSFQEGVKAFASILDVKSAILPVSVDKATLVAELTNGSRIYGENAIDIPRGNQREKIKQVFLVPHHSASISVYLPVIQAINNADFIFVGPGDLFTSIIPNLIVPGVKEALQECKATIIYIVNIMTKFGETQLYKGYDFIQKIEEFIPIRIIVYNREKPEENITNEYKKQKSEFVEIDKDEKQWENYLIYESDLLDTSGGIVRHNSQKLAFLLQTIMNDVGCDNQTE